MDTDLRSYIQKREHFCLQNSETPEEQGMRLDVLFELDSWNLEQKLASQYQGFKEFHSTTKQALHSETETWVGLHPQTLQTPYYEILDMLESLPARRIQKIVDLGAAYGRVGLVMQAVLPQASFCGYEIVEERVRLGQTLFDHLGLVQCSLKGQDILKDDFCFPDADAYFIYDFAGPELMRNILDKLQLIAMEKDIFVMARGQGILSLICQSYPIFTNLRNPLFGINWGVFANFE